jgi:hypothetical protein
MALLLLGTAHVIRACSAIHQRGRVRFRRTPCARRPSSRRRWPYWHWSGGPACRGPGAVMPARRRSRTRERRAWHPHHLPEASRPRSGESPLAPLGPQRASSADRAADVRPALEVELCRKTGVVRFAEWTLPGGCLRMTAVPGKRRHVSFGGDSVAAWMTGTGCSCHL